MPAIPWYGKIAAKIVLSRIPLGYHVWRRLRIFRHGVADSPQYSLDVFRKHYERATFARKGQAFAVLEIGPGDTLFSALVAYAYGADRVWLVDVQDFATRRVEPYRAMAAALAARGMRVPDLARARTLEDVLQACGARYLTRGVASLAEVPDGSIDLVWSQAVLEHVRRSEFGQLARELKRIMCSDGGGSHTVDLGDHLGGALDNLRFPSPLWESPFMSRSGFYTNRLRRAEIVQAFRDVGFEVATDEIVRWPAVPTPVSRMSQEFRHWPEEELTVRGFGLLHASR